jgi:hypothetical protein
VQNDGGQLKGFKMNNTRSDAARARAEAIFCVIAQDEGLSALGEYRAKQQAELDKTARLRAQRLAREAQKISGSGLKK